MKVQVKQNAGAIYGASLGRRGVIDWKWSTICHMVAGEVLTVETAHLFADQFNIAPVTGADLDRMKAKLLTEWGADLYRTRFASPTTGESKALDALSGSGIRLTAEYVETVIDDERPARFACGYCGAQTTDPEKTGYWCNACIGFENLTPDRLDLLHLINVMDTRDQRTRRDVPVELLELHHTEKARLLQEWNSKEADRMEARRLQVIADAATAREQINRGEQVILSLYAAGIDAKKYGTVYYPHTDTAQIGAILYTLNADEMADIRAKLQAAGDAVPVKISIKGAK